MSNYYYNKKQKGSSSKNVIYQTGSSCVVLTMQDRVEIATLFSILLKVERRSKDDLRTKNGQPPKSRSIHSKIKGSLNREPFDFTLYLLYLFYCFFKKHCNFFFLYR